MPNRESMAMQSRAKLRLNIGKLNGRRFSNGSPAPRASRRCRTPKASRQITPMITEPIARRAESASRPSWLSP